MFSNYHCQFGATSIHVPQRLRNLFFKSTTTKSIPTAAVNTSMLIILESTMTLSMLLIDSLRNSLLQQSLIVEFVKLSGAIGSQEYYWIIIFLFKQIILIIFFFTSYYYCLCLFFCVLLQFFFYFSKSNKKKLVSWLIYKICCCKLKYRVFHKFLRYFIWPDYWKIYDAFMGIFKKN